MTLIERFKNTRFFSFVFGTEATHHKGNDFNLTTHGFNTDKDIVSVQTTCIKILSETIAKMPLHVLKENGNGVVSKDDGTMLFDILRRQPNGYTNHNTFMQTLEYWRNKRGNSYARIHRTGRGVKSLEHLPPWRVKGYKLVDNILFYEVVDKKGENPVDVNQAEILHFKMMAPDGVMGISPVQALALNMGIMHKGLHSIDHFYENNALSPKALKHIVGAANVTKNKEAMEEFKKEYTGAANAGKWIDLPPNTDVIDLAINLADAQILESLRFNGQQISALYGVPVYMATGDFTQSKYNNIEQSQLSFKVNTISSITKMYEAEFESKLLTDNQRKTRKIRFNINSLVEPDLKTKTEAYGKLHQIGALNAKKIAELENLPTENVTEDYFVMTNLQPVKKALLPEAAKPETRK